MSAGDDTLLVDIGNTRVKWALTSGGDLRQSGESIHADGAVTQPAGCGVVNGYEDPRQMGVDRWLAMLAAHREFSCAVCVVDAGTAVTIDQVDADGRHLGGVIVPGLGLMRRALLGETGRIGESVVNEAGSGTGRGVLGHSTDEAIDGGGLAAICGLIEQCAAELAGRSRDNVLVVTGGDAVRIVPHLRVAVESRPRLVLRGLAFYEFD